MTTVDRWLLPDGVEEVLPVPAAKVEQLRRALLDLYDSWGYQLVIPPLVEFTESLLIGLGADIEMLTFRVTDQLSGRSMGIRADITPQVARIDAHSLAQPGVSRLCYAGSVLHTRPASLLASRSPIKLGAELYGDSSLQADIEVISLMLETLKHAGIEGCTLDLGHVGIYHKLLAECGLSEAHEQQVFDALQRKSLPDLNIVLAEVPSARRQQILELASLHGGEAVLDRVNWAPEAVAEVREVAAAISERYPEVNVYFDLSELRGYHYHTGLVFAAYVDGHGQAVANGGRYDDVGQVFGRARPATGFNTDLKALLPLLSDSLSAASGNAICAPAQASDGLWQRVSELRAAGEVVISSLSGEVDPRCDRQLVCRNGEWEIESVGEKEL
jgi:ATP phosphoribosyltransferase regulatory subunit